MKPKQQQHFSCFTFTPEMIRTTQKALALFEQSLQIANSHHSKIEFAEETMNQVKSKLDLMNTSVGLACLTTFDYNEKIVIATAIRLYTVDLLSGPFNPQNEKELMRCKKIARFALDELDLNKVNQHPIRRKKK